MGSTDIPPFLRQKQKEQAESSDANIPPFLKKKDEQTNGENGGQEPLPFDNSGFVSTLNVNRFNEPEIETENGAKLAVNSRAIPVTPYVNQKDYVQDVQDRIKLGKTTPQDQKFIANVKKANSNFTQEDDTDLSNIAHNYHLPTEYPDIDSKITAVNQLKDMIQKKQMREDEENQSFGGTGGVSTITRNAGVPKGDNAKEIERLNEIQNKLAIEKNKSDVAPIYMDVAVRTDNSGNLLKKALAGIALFNPSTNIAGQLATSQQTQDHIEKQPPEFSIGLNGLKYTEPEQYKRVTNMLTKGEPLSESEVATITAQGLDTKQAIVKDAYVKGDLNAEQYQKENDNIQKTRYDNIVNNKETLRAFLSNGIANLADDIKSTQSDFDPNVIVAKKIFGHTWNYTDDEIESLGKTYAQANGIDPNDARVKEAIKYLQDNEGAMIMENSIAKSGYIRDLAKGLASPIRSTFNTIEDIGKTSADIYAETRSAGNVNVAEDRVNRIKNNPIENAVSDVLEGTGQFLTQAGMAAATTSALGVIGEAALGANMGASTSGELVGTVPKLGKMLMGSKDAVSTFVTSYAMAYDPDLRQALTYTSDDAKARATAGVMASLEGATELFLSPLEIAEGIGKKFLNKKKISRGIIDVLNDDAIVNKSLGVKDFLKKSLGEKLASLKEPLTTLGKGVLETGRVALAEIGEEEVTQLADYASNAILNPQSKSFQNRDVANEVANTAWQTGLSMALPAIVSGIGAYKVNNFSKGTLLVAAQNRQQLIDDMNKRLHNGDMTQDEYNQKATIINTAAKANDILPVKDNGKPLDTKEKANYIYSRVSEAILNRQLKVLEEDKSRSAGKIGEGEEATNVQDPEITQIKKKIEAQVKYRTDILNLKPQYYVDNEPVSKDEFNTILKSDDRDKYDLSVENDNKAQEKLREVGGKDVKVKDATAIEKKETKVAPVVEVKEVKEEPVATLDIEEEVPQVQESGVSPLQNNLQAARESVKNIPVEQKEEVVAPAPIVPSLTNNLEAARNNPTVKDNTVEQADKRAKELLGEKLPVASVPTMQENLAASKRQQDQEKLKNDLEAQKSATQADERVKQIKRDKIPLTENANNALSKMVKVKGKKLGVFASAAKNDPKGFLNFVAEQALGITSGIQSEDKNKLGDAKREAIKSFTKEVVDEAILFHNQLNKKNEVIKEINSKNLTHVKNTGMGSKEGDGIYISTENGNRYASDKNEADKVSVTISNPKVTDYVENTELQQSKLATLIKQNKITANDISPEFLPEVANYVNKKLDDITASDITKWHNATQKGINEDLFYPSARKKAAELITEQYKNEGYDAIYIPENEVQEGQLIVFDRKNVIEKNNKNKENETKINEPDQSYDGKKGSSDISQENKNSKRKRIKGTRKANRKIIHPTQLKALSLEVQSAYDKALQYFISGGKVNPSAIKELFGTKNKDKKISGEQQSKLDLVNRTAGSINEVAHGLWENEDENSNLTTQDFKDAVELTLLNFNSRTKMAEDLLSRFKAKEDDIDMEYIKYLNQTYEEVGSEDSVDEAINILEGLSDFEIQRIINENDLGNDYYINKIIAENEGDILPEIKIEKSDVDLFNAIEKSLSISGKKNQQMELERLYSGKNAKYTKEQVDAAIAINKNFDNIVKDMNNDGLLTKECPT